MGFEIALESYPNDKSTIYIDHSDGSYSEYSYEEGVAQFNQYMDTPSIWCAVLYGEPPFPVEKTNGERLRDYFDDTTPVNK